MEPKRSRLLTPLERLVRTLEFQAMNPEEVLIPLRLNIFQRTEAPKMFSARCAVLRERLRPGEHVNPDELIAGIEMADEAPDIEEVQEKALEYVLYWLDRVKVT